MADLARPFFWIEVSRHFPLRQAFLHDIFIRLDRPTVYDGRLVRICNIYLRIKRKALIHQTVLMRQQQLCVFFHAWLSRVAKRQPQKCLNCLNINVCSKHCVTPFSAELSEAPHCNDILN